MNWCVSITSDWMSGVYYTPDFMPENMNDIYPNGDIYLAQLKACLLQIDTELDIRDLNHHITPGGVAEAIHVLQANFAIFPLGSIHLLCVDSEPSAKKPMLLVFYKGHYFAGAFSPNFCLLFDSKPDWVIALNLLPEPRAFRALSSFMYVVNALIHQIDLDRLGKKVELNIAPKMGIGGVLLQTRIAFIDTFGNLVCALHKDEFEYLLAGRKFHICLANMHVYSISEQLTADNCGQLSAYYNTENYLCVGIPDQHFALEWGYSVGELIDINLEFRLF